MNGKVSSRAKTIRVLESELLRFTTEILPSIAQRNKRAMVIVLFDLYASTYDAL